MQHEVKLRISENLDYWQLFEHQEQMVFSPEKIFLDNHLLLQSNQPWFQKDHFQRMKI